MQDTYHFNDNDVNVIWDFGVITDRNFTFSQQIEIARNKAMQILGFVKRNSADFSGVSVIKILYTSLVGPTLENSWHDWLLYYFTPRYAIKVQRIFFKYMAFKLRIPVNTINYAPLERKLKIGSLKHKRNYADIVFASVNIFA